MLYFRRETNVIFPRFYDSRPGLGLKLQRQGVGSSRMLEMMKMMMNDDDKDDDK
jgi:hypothetical protein